GDLRSTVHREAHHPVASPSTRSAGNREWTMRLPREGARLSVSRLRSPVHAVSGAGAIWTFAKADRKDTLDLHRRQVSRFESCERGDSNSHGFPARHYVCGTPLDGASQGI